jgi:DNA-directed RNA polymerase specialized sigma24 family protein
MALALCGQTPRDDGLADDAVQEAILQAYLGLERLQQPARFGAWLAGIALNIRRRARSPKPNAWRDFRPLSSGSTPTCRAL